MLKVQGLSVERRGKKILENIGFEIKQGRSLGVIGCSGAGKTTLAMSILDLLDNALILGEISSDGKSSLVMQNPDTALDPCMKIKKQIYEVKEADTDEITLFKEVGIGEPERILNSYPHQISGGTKQRVLLAMALCCGASLMIADEPAANLDPPLRFQIIKLIKHLSKEKGISVLFITHDISLAALLCDDILVMDGGKIVEHAPTTELMQNPSQEYTQKLIRASKMDMTESVCS